MDGKRICFFPPLSGALRQDGTRQTVDFSILDT